MRLALEGACRLPAEAAVGFGARLGRWVARCAPRERSRAALHLAAAFGGDPGDSRFERLAVAVFEHLGRSAGELAWAWRSAERVRSRVRFAPGAIERFGAAAGSGVLFVTGHVGNWELLAWAIELAGIRSASVGRQSYDPGLTALIGAWRGRWGARVLWRESPAAGREILGALGEGISVGVLIDQATDLPSVSVPFFGRPARTVAGPARLALAHRIPVVVGWIRRRPDGLHVVEIEPSEPPAPHARDPVSSWTASWTGMLERAVRDEPDQWVWMHDRWR